MEVERESGLKLALEVVADSATGNRFLVPRSAAALHQFMIQHLRGHDAAFALWRANGVEPAPGVRVSAIVGRLIYDEVVRIALETNGMVRQYAERLALKNAKKAKRAEQRKVKTAARAAAGLKRHRQRHKSGLPKLVEREKPVPPTPEQLASFLERLEEVRQDREFYLLNGGPPRDGGPSEARALGRGCAPVPWEIGDEAGVLASRYRQHVRLLIHDVEDELSGREHTSPHWQRAGGGWHTGPGW